MNIFQRYIARQNDHYSKCLDHAGDGIAMFVVIPCYNEPDIALTLESLANCHPPEGKVSVLIVVNDAENSTPESISRNNSTLEEIAEWKKLHPDLFFHVQRIYAHALPQKWAGVGWARKLGMDEAVKQIAASHSSDGIIISLDADSTVSPNYFQTIEQSFKISPQNNFFLLNFEHPLDGKGLDEATKEGLIRYELHMRYYKNAMCWSGYPHAIHTVGSSFTLKASAYVKQGGMNRRKAGEDFYFLHKLVLLDHYGTINATTVIPASRISDRVPFGTGAALKKWTEGSSELFSTYSLEAFGHLKTLFTNSSKFWSLSKEETAEFFDSLNPTLQSYCINMHSVDQLLELKDNCSNALVFQKRYFHLFNAFWILKYLNFVHDEAVKRIDLKNEAKKLLVKLGIPISPNSSLENILGIYRALDKGEQIPNLQVPT